MPANASSLPSDAQARTEAKAAVRVRLLTGLAFFLSLLVGVVVVGLGERSRELEARATAHKVALLYAHNVQERLARSLSATYALAAVLNQGNGRIENFEQLGETMLGVYGGINALQLAKDGIVSASVPRAGNEKAIGHNLLEDTARNKEARMAVATRELTLAGPFELLQGGMAVIGRLPVFLPAGRDQTRFWGFTIALIHVPDLLQASHLDGLREQGYRYRLWRIHPDRLDRQVIAGAADAAMSDPVETVFDVPNAKWTLSVEPVAGWYSPLGLALQGVIVVLIAGLFAAVTHTVLMQPLRLQREVAQRTREFEFAKVQAENASAEKSAFIANMSHDIRSPMNTILGTTYLLKRDGVAPGQGERLDKIEAAGKQVLLIINSMHDPARVESGAFIRDEAVVCPEAIASGHEQGIAKISA